MGAGRPPSGSMVKAKDLSEALGDHAGAASYFRVAQQIERAAWDSGPRQPQALARFLADHDRDISEAVIFAEEAARSRRDIFTMDVLAGVLESGPFDGCPPGFRCRARTGSKNARLLWHAAEIRAAGGEPTAAIELLRRIPALETIGEVRVRAGIRALQQRLAN